MPGDPGNCERAAGNSRFHFFLGGRDLEMAEIKRILAHYAPGQTTDKGLAWGARLSDYRAEIEAAYAQGKTAVAIELTDDLPKRWKARRSLLEIDHHGKRAGANVPSALEQVFDMLDLPKRAWTRRRALIAANDIGHVAGMDAAGASLDEILAIRAADRRAQGVTAQDETEARRAIVARTRKGHLTVIETASRTSTAIADLMLPELGGPGYNNLLVAMPDKLAFFGEGRVVRALARIVEGSWSGGALPERGYWGTEMASRVERTALLSQIVDLTQPA